jgi:hypothetical protein
LYLDPAIGPKAFREAAGRGGRGAAGGRILQTWT